MRIILLFILLLSSCVMASNAQSSSGDLKQIFEKANDYYTGSNGVFLNKEKAFELYKEAAEGGYVPAMMRLASFYNNGEVVDADESLYFKWILAAAESGNADAQNRAGVCYHDGKGIVRDSEKAVYWYKLAAGQGNVYAMNNLKLCYKSIGDKKESLKWMRAAAEHGHSECQYELGNAYQNGNGFKEDIEQAIYWFKLAAEQNHAEAYNQLGVIYSNDLRDYAKSHDCIKKAAELGSKTALYNMGYDYEFGLGTEIDYKLAEQYYLQAISKPESSLINNARYRLGMIYYEGKGSIKKDKKKGRQLLQDAAVNGYKDAKDYLEKNKETWTITVNGEKVYEKVN